MQQLLSLQTSLFGDQATSAVLSERFIAAMQSAHPQLAVSRRDLNADPIPHLDADAFNGFRLDENERTPSQLQAAQLSDQLINELKLSDAIVLGLPLYNFGIPSTLKAWIDHICRAGATFQYGNNGPEGLLTGKKLYVIATRGGQYAGTPADTQTDYIRNVFSFVGIRDIEFIYAEGMAMGEIREQSLTQAQNLLDQKALNSIESAAA